MTDAPSHATTFRDVVTDYLEHQDAEHLQRLRRTIVSSATFDPDLNLLAEAGPLLEAGRHQEVVDTITSKMPGAALNQTAHGLLSVALRALGDEQGAERERIMTKLSISSILSTGDGTQESPWSVLRVADEYDLMRARGIVPGDQSSRQVDGRMVDRHETEDGGEVWFVVDRPEADETRRSDRSGVSHPVRAET